MQEAVPASIRYLRPEWKDRAALPEVHSRETRRANTQFHDVEIHDARPLAERGELDLDTTGFTLIRHRSATRDFRDSEQVELVYYRELRELMQKLTGARHVLFLHHLLRTENPQTFTEAYARFVHCDFSDRSVAHLTQRMLTENGICSPDEVERFDVAWFNAWQPIEREVQQNPLTLIDARTLAEDDLVEYTFGADEFGTGTMPVFDPRQRHFYFPRMRPDELIILKQYDSREGRSRHCPHTSFDDATAPADALPRRSIEVRMMCAF